MLKTQATATASVAANAATQMGETVAFTIPSRLRPVGFKVAAGTIIATLIMSVAYFGFGINLGVRMGTAAEHVINTAEHSLQVNFDAPYINHYGFKSLFPAQQRVYADIYRAAFLTRDMVTVNDMTDAEINDLVQVVRNDSPELFYLNPEVSIETTTISTGAEHSVSTVHLTYSMDKQNVPAAREEFKTTLSETVAVAATCQSDANKVNMIQSWMQENAKATAADYDAADEVAPTTTAYDVMMNGEGSSEGNAQLFNALCSEVGISSYTVDNDSAAAENATNAVMLGNDWHYVDIASESNAVLA